MGVQRRDDKHSGDPVEEIADVFNRIDGQDPSGERKTPLMRITGDRRDTRSKKPSRE
ncbi:MAG: hypothetical protein ACRDRN_13800 [Sciscionella sp.]